MLVSRSAEEQRLFNLAMAMFGPDCTFVPVSELRKGDVIAPCGEWIDTVPQYIADDDAWTFGVVCPEGGPFQMRLANIETPVFNRR